MHIYSVLTLFLTLQISNPPDDLIRPISLISGSYAVKQETKKSLYGWSTLSKSVTFKRKERETTTHPWHQQEQPLSASFFVIDVRTRCNNSGEIRSAFVAGFDGSTSPAEAVIQEWKFTYPRLPETVHQGSFYTPIDQRPLLTVERIVHFRGSGLGSIRCLEVDPAGRFVVFVTYENPTVYQMSLPTGTPQVLAGSSSYPEIADIGALFATEHITEGPMIQLLPVSRWAHGASESWIVVLPDPNDDGVFGLPQVLTFGDQSSRGYFDASNWTRPCRD